MLYLVELDYTVPQSCIVDAFTPNDAAVAFDRHWQGDDRVEDAILEAGTFDAYYDSILDHYKVTEIDRNKVNAYIQRRLDGETNITILL